MKCNIHCKHLLWATVLAASSCSDDGTGITGDADHDILLDTPEIDTYDSYDVDISVEDTWDVTDDSHVDIAEWDPPIDNLGDPGWRESETPFCREDDGFFSPRHIWSDLRGVLVTYPNTDMPPVNSIIFNDGSGWRNVYEPDPYDPERDLYGTEKLEGVIGGTIFGWSPDRGMVTELLLEAVTLSREDFGAFDLHVVRDSLAYALVPDDPRLFLWDGISWGPFAGAPLLHDVGHIWADETSLFVAGDLGLILSYGDGVWDIHDTRTTSSITSLWGFHANDVWAGTYHGELLHYNGTEWATVSWPSQADDSDMCRSRNQPIVGMWGYSERLFFHSRHELVTESEGVFTILGYWPGIETHSGPTWYCDGWLSIQAIWGNSSTELFILVMGSEVVVDVCSEFVLFWDGAMFHRF